MGLISHVVAALAKSAEGDEDSFVVDAVALAVACDGDVSEEEIGYACDLVATSGLKDVAPETLRHRFDDAFERLSSEGWEARLTAVSESSRARGCGRELLWLAVAVQYVDGDVSEDEDAFIDALASAVGMSDDDVQQIIDDVEARLGIPPEDAAPPAEATG